MPSFYIPHLRLIYPLFCGKSYAAVYFFADNCAAIYFFAEKVMPENCAALYFFAENCAALYFFAENYAANLPSAILGPALYPPHGFSCSTTGEYCTLFTPS
jgi:hypothetical protein